MKPVYKLLFVFIIPVVLILYANSSGSPGGKSGSPGDGNTTCTQCHTGTATPQSGWITSNIPADGYTPGQTYQITATGTHSGVVKFGFELTAETSAGVKTGTFVITDATRTKLINANKAVTHTTAGNVPTGNTSTWTMNWTAPVTNVGQVRFYAAFNATNGNGNTGGDVVYTSTLFVNAAAPAALLSVVPNSANQGSNPTLTITGQNTSWTGTNPNVRLRKTGAPANIITANSVTVVSNTQLQANFSIPGDATPGLWDVLVDDLVLASSFTVVQVVPLLVSVNPDFAEQGANENLIITGQNTSWAGTNPNVRLRNVATPAEIIQSGTVTVNSNTQLVAAFSIPQDASTGLWDLLVDDLVLANAFSVLAVIPELISVNPNNADQGSNPTLTISGQNTQWAGTSPNVRLRKTGAPSDIIAALSVVVTNNTQLQANFSIASDATSGFYDVLVDDLVLTSAFTVNQLVPSLVSVNPDTAGQGEAVDVTITGLNTFWQGTSPTVSMTYSGSLPTTIEASSVTVTSNTTLVAVFNIPADATVGLWDVNVNGLVLEESFTITLVESIYAINSEKVSIFPNPATDFFRVSIPGNAIIQVRSMSGQIVLERELNQGTTTLSAAQFVKGVYLVEVKGEQFGKLIKLVVK